MRVLIWHVHGGWMDGFVRGDHTYLLPTEPGAGTWGLGRGGRPWPERAREVPTETLREEPIDVVVLQRPEELERVTQLTGRRPGRDVPAVFLEHNTPKREPVTERHPLADQDEIPIVQVTHFNRVVWDTGRAPTVVIEHGVPDHGPGYRGGLARLAFVSNEPVRRRRIVGADLLPAFFPAAGIDAYGIGAEALPSALGVDHELVRPIGDLAPDELRVSLADRRCYLHLSRWTSLGLSLLEAMTLGMPVVVLDATEAARAVPAGTGFVSTSVDDLVAAARRLVDDPDTAMRLGAAARQAALERYGLERFLRDWDTVLTDVTERASRRRSPRATATVPAIPDIPEEHRPGEGT